MMPPEIRTIAATHHAAPPPRLQRGLRRGMTLGVSLFAVNAGVWAWAVIVFGSNPVLLGTAFLAYAFGLRHAVDADHIAAIDNATRKLVEARRPAAATGLWFSLGHATVVVLACAAIALTSTQLETLLAGLQPLAGAVFTGFSATCLLVLAGINAVVLIAVLRLIAAMRRGEQPTGPELQRLLAQRGVLGRLLRGLFRLVARSWHMYPIGFLFGLGFDTATEIGLLGVSAAQASHGLPLATVMVFPSLFTAGMAFVDSLDGLLMARAYRWASDEPRRKLYYNLTVTLASVIVAVAVGAIELLGLLAPERADSRLWQLVQGINGHLGAVGAAIIVLFAASWGLSVLIWRARSAASG